MPWVDFSSDLLFSIARAALTNDHELGGLKQQKFILLDFWKPEVQNQGVGRTSESSRGGSFHASCSFWCLLTIPGIPWLVDATPQSLPLPSYGLLSPVCLLCLQISLSL